MLVDHYASFTVTVSEPEVPVKKEEEEEDG